jgi:hypothetical protein
MSTTTGVIAGYSAVLIWAILRFRVSLMARIFCFFLGLTLLGLSFTGLIWEPPLETLKASRIVRVRSWMSQHFQTLILSGNRLEEEFPSLLNQFTQQIERIIDPKRPSRKTSRSTRIKSFLEQQRLETGISFFLHNGERFYRAPGVIPGRDIQWLAMIYPLIRERVIGHRHEGPDSTLRGQATSRLVQGLVNGIFGDQRLLHNFMNNPHKLFAVDAQGRKLKRKLQHVFWSYFEASDGVFWVVIGSIPGGRYLKTLGLKLEASLRPLTGEQGAPSDIFLEGDASGEIIAFPEDMGGALRRTARLVRSSGQPVFHTQMEKSGPVYYFGDIFPTLPDFVLVLRAQLASLPQHFDTPDNQILRLGAGLGVLLLLISWGVARSIKKFYATLETCFSQTEKEGFRSQISWKGSDLLSQFAELFNTAVDHSLKHKALHHLDSRTYKISRSMSQVPEKKEILLLQFCLYANRNSYLENPMEFESVTRDLGVVQAMIQAHGGYVCEFNGQSGRALFQGDIDRVVLREEAIYHSDQNLAILRAARGILSLKTRERPSMAGSSASHPEPLILLMRGSGILSHLAGFGAGGIYSPSGDLAHSSLELFTELRKTLGTSGIIVHESFQSKLQTKIITQELSFTCTFRNQTHRFYELL